MLATLCSLFPLHSGASPRAGRVWLQSDVFLAARHMRNAFFEAVQGSFAPDPQVHTPAACVRDEAAEPAETDLEGAQSEGASEGCVSAASNLFLGWSEAGWLASSPLSVPTEREVHTLERGGSVWRFMLVRL